MTVENKFKVLSNSKINKILVLVSIFCLNIVLLTIALGGSAKGYEISIFNVYPMYLWISIVVSISSAIILLLLNAFSPKKKIWVWSLFIILFTNLIILELPLFRGYALFGRSDVLTHLGYVNDILNYGTIGTQNYYPISHLVVVNMAFLTNISPNIIINGIAPVINLIYILGIVLLARTLTKNKGELQFVTAFSAILLFTYFGSMFLPTSLSFKFIPIVLYIYFNSRNPSKSQLTFSLLLIVTLLFMTFFHPLTAIILILVLLIIQISVFIRNSRFNSNNNKSAKKFVERYKDASTPFFLLSIFLFIWFSSFAIFGGTIRRVFSWLVSESGSTPLQTYSSSWTSSGLDILQFLNLLFQSYGHQLIYILLALFFVLVLLIRFIRKKGVKFDEIFLSLSFISFSIFAIVSFVGNLTFSNPERVYVYALLFATMLNGIMSYRLICRYGQRKTVKKLLLSILAVLLIISASVGIYSSYASVSSGSINSQVTYSELAATNWFFKNNDQSSKIYSVGNEMSRFFEFNEGKENTFYKRYTLFLKAGDHFNFTDSEKGYLILTDYTKARYENYQYNNPDFTKEDIESLNNNTKLDKIYSDDGMDIWTKN